MQVFTKCRYCGELAILEISTRAQDPELPSTFWICPYIGCARENTIHGVVVQAVTRVEIPVHEMHMTWLRTDEASHARD